MGSAGKDSYGTIHSPYHLNVVDIGKDGTLSLAYQMNVSGFPKGSGTLNTAYEEQTGYVYVYFTTDSTNGSIYLLKDKAGLTSPGEVCHQIFLPVSGKCYHFRRKCRR